MIIWTQAVALPGVYFFSCALILSQILGHVVLHRSLAQPEAQLRPWYDDAVSIDRMSELEKSKIKSIMAQSSQVIPNSDGTGSISSGVCCTTLITISSFFAFFLLLAGVMVPAVHLEYEFSLRIHKWMLDENIEIHNIQETYSVISAMNTIAQVNHIGATNVGMSIFIFFFVIFAPLARSFCAIVLWFVPLSKNVQATYATAINIFSIFAGADVFAVTAFIMIWQLPHLFENMEEAAKYVTLSLTAYNGLYLLLLGGFLDTFVSPLVYNKYVGLLEEERLKEDESAIPFAKVSNFQVDSVESGNGGGGRSNS